MLNTFYGTLVRHMTEKHGLLSCTIISRASR